MMARTSIVFESIESAHHYIGLLCEALDEEAQVIKQEMAAPSALARGRHLDALRLVDHKLNTLRKHFVVSRRLLGDLRTLRRYLLDERASERAASQGPASEGSQRAPSDQIAGHV
jgi:hypothetical protein